MRRRTVVKTQTAWSGVRARTVLAAISLALAVVGLLATGGLASPAGENQDYDYGPLPELIVEPSPPPFEVVAPPPEVTTPVGSQVFAVNCSACHGAAGEGTAHAPTLIGEGSGLFSYSRDGLYDFVSTRMPFSNPGSLSEAEYWAVVDFLRAANGI